MKITRALFLAVTFFGVLSTAHTTLCAASAPVTTIDTTNSTNTKNKTPATIDAPTDVPSVATPAIMDNPKVLAFIDEMAEKHDFNKKELRKWFAKAQFQPSIIAAISKPAEQKPWYAYEAIFMTPQRIQGGKDFLKKNAKALARAEETYGVPREIITAIIGVETLYGKQAGTYSVLDSLITLGFYYPPRSAFFLSELEAFLLLVREEHWDPTRIKGSYAGAMGIGQFIASSYRRFSVDFDDDGKRDIIGSVDDAIGSVANYFHVHGWQMNAPVIVPAQVAGERYAALFPDKKEPKPTHHIAALKKYGVKLAANADLSKKAIKEEPFALVRLQGKEGDEFWLGARNFYVITRYNRSNHYAMAVYMLSQAITIRD